MSRRLYDPGLSHPARTEGSHSLDVFSISSSVPMSQVYFCRPVPRSPRERASESTAAFRSCWLNGPVLVRQSRQDRYKRETGKAGGEIDDLHGSLLLQDDLVADQPRKNHRQNPATAPAAARGLPAQRARRPPSPS